MAHTNVVSPNATLLEIIEVILVSKTRTCFVADSTGLLLGVVTEGDLIRAYKVNRILQTRAHSVMNQNPIFAKKELSSKEFMEVFISKGIESIPIVNIEHRIISIQNLRDTKIL